MSAFTAKRIEYFGLGQNFDGSGRRPKRVAWTVLNLQGKPMSALLFNVAGRRTEDEAREMAMQKAAELNASIRQ